MQGFELSIFAKSSDKKYILVLCLIKRKQIDLSDEKQMVKEYSTEPEEKLVAE